MRSLESSSTTMISCGTLRRSSSRWRCSTVDAMQPSSSRAGMMTESKLSDEWRVTCDEFKGQRD